MKSILTSCIIVLLIISCSSPQEKDEKTAKILQSVFPNRKIVVIDALAVNLGSVNIHCISMNQRAQPDD
jgi:agmatine/peptidylarginine deiminase